LPRPPPPPSAAGFPAWSALRLIRKHCLYKIAVCGTINTCADARMTNVACKFYASQRAPHFGSNFTHDATRQCKGASTHKTTLTWGQARLPLRAQHTPLPAGVTTADSCAVRGGVGCSAGAESGGVRGAADGRVAALGWQLGTCVCAHVEMCVHVCVQQALGVVACMERLMVLKMAAR
jgi:hypothetical protein